jgi:hypothetical protein
LPSVGPVKVGVIEISSCFYYGFPLLLDFSTSHHIIFSLFYKKQRSFNMVNIRKKRVAMTKQLKREVLMACIVRVSRGILPIGSFKAVGEHFQIDPKTVATGLASASAQSFLVSEKKGILDGIMISYRRKYFLKRNMAVLVLVMLWSHLKLIPPVPAHLGPELQ